MVLEGLILGFSSQALTLSTLHEWGRNVEMDTLQGGRDSGL